MIAGNVRGASRRGYTLVELGVVVILSSILVLGMVRWMVGVGTTAKVGFENAAEQGRELAFEQMRRDIRAVRHCDEAGLDARVREVNESGFTVVTETDEDAGAEIVTWRLTGGVLERGEADLTGECAGSAGGWVTWASDVSSVLVELHSEGTADQLGTAGTCAQEWSGRCDVRSISVRVETMDDPLGETVVLRLP